MADQARPRYSIGYRKDVIKNAIASMQNILPLFYRTVCTTFHVFFCATEFEEGRQELEDNLAWAYGRKGCRYEPANGVYPKYNDHCAFVSSLTVRERRRLRVYSRQWPGNIYMLNQNPESKPVKSRDGRMHCLIKNTGLQWCSEAMLPLQEAAAKSAWVESKAKQLKKMLEESGPTWDNGDGGEDCSDSEDVSDGDGSSSESDDNFGADGRYMVPKEFLVCQGFPAYSGMHPKSLPCTSFRIPRQAGHPRLRRAVCEQAGNSMHLNVVGAVLMYCLFFLEHK
jgi:hypothetical protein